MTDPEDHDPADAQWDFDRLPLRWPISHKPIGDKIKQIELIRSFVNEASLIIHAGDNDSEGQLVVEEVLRYVGNKSPVQRLLINDMNTKIVKRALVSMRDNKEFRGLYLSALVRSVADQRYGYTLTRGYTLAAKKAGSDIGVSGKSSVTDTWIGCSA